MKYKCKIDKGYLIFYLVLELLFLIVPIVSFILKDIIEGLVELIPFAIITFCFTSSLNAYVILHENELFIKYGFILKKSIPYEKIIGIEKKKQFICESIIAIKNSKEHIDIKYNKFDVTSISVKNNDFFINELKEKIALKKENLS